jgi:hypothetical protein
VDWDGWSPERPSDFVPRPAVILCAGPDEPFNEAVARTSGDGFLDVPRLFLAGRRPDGAFATLPMFTPHAFAECEIRRLGQALQPQDVLGLPEDRGSFAIRVVREGERVRYAFGRYRKHVRPMLDWTTTDVVRTDAEIREPGRGPLLPDLANLLASETCQGPGVHVSTVWLDVSDSALVIDVVRAVECAGGDPGVVFWVVTFPWWYPQLEGEIVSGPLAPGVTGHGLLNPKEAEGIRVRVTRTGRLFWGREQPTEEAMVTRLSRPVSRKGYPSYLLLHADRRASWRSVRPLVVAAGTGDRTVRVEVATVAHGLSGRTMYEIPRGGDEDVALDLSDAGTEREPAIAGRRVLLSAPDDATTEEVLTAVVDLVKRGAAGVSFR